MNSSVASCKFQVIP